MLPRIASSNMLSTKPQSYIERHGNARAYWVTYDRFIYRIRRWKDIGLCLFSLKLLRNDGRSLTYLDIPPVWLMGFKSRKLLIPQCSITFLSLNLWNEPPHSWNLRHEFIKNSVKLDFSFCLIRFLISCDKIISFKNSYFSKMDSFLSKKRFFWGLFFELQKNE